MFDAYPPGRRLLKIIACYELQSLLSAPGFIDTHSHHDWGLEKSPQSAINQYRFIAQLLVQLLI